MKDHAARVAAELRKNGMNVSLVNGGKGEFTVLVDGREVTGKGDSLPDVSEVMDAVRGTATAV